jgi:hypothetical protein
MALDPRISLAAKAPTPVGDIFRGILQNIGTAQQQDITRQQAPLVQEQLEMQTELQRAQQPALLQQAEFAASGGTQLTNQQQQAQQIATNYATALHPLLNNPQALVQELQNQKVQFQNAGVPTTGIDEDIAQVQTPEGLAQLKAETDSVLRQATGQTKSVSQREFEDNIALVEADPKLETSRGRAAAIALGLEAKESLTAAERIAQNETLADAIADVEGKKATATEEAKLKAQKKFKPQITRAVKLAEKEASEQGEVLTDLSRMEAALPGLKESVGELRELSLAATSTLAGKAYDFIVKQSGFGGTKGATARDKFLAIVKNQVLPLLKETFGSQFTEKEGEALMATMGDVDATHESRMAQLDAFITQKERNIRTKEAQLEQAQEQVTPQASTQEGARATNPQTGQVAIFTNGKWVVQ